MNPKARVQGAGRGPGKVLVVDDQVPLAENLAEILADAGHASLVAQDAREAIDLVAEGGVLVLITDFRLEGANGAELILTLRRRGHRVPAVVMSAYTDPGTVAESRDAGAVRVLAKPLDIPALLNLIKTLCTGAIASGPEANDRPDDSNR